VPTPTLTCAERPDRRAGSDGVQHANCPAKSYYFQATRGAGLVQIANALFENFMANSGVPDG
ncbi:MAG TPA: hypothetical protein VK638_53965, partial [Edaphobacter sp.]|nr:hypothetical protein [Edaphobacter sp.]